ncbi:hypothetical protein [Geminocystis sp. GBBB08]|uniref:hypothetical protein n=1 Tax=Geminocystis sp. GBBB08 TaxID=2604140 RepID=UPI0027E3025F|nr:hypothetical protein [Geminocystis sp. GBBB08]
MNLMLEDGIELPETTEIVFIGNLTSQQLKLIKNKIDYQISLNKENLSITREQFNVITLEQWKNITTPKQIIYLQNPNQDIYLKLMKF